MDLLKKKDLIEFLKPFVLEKRYELFNRVLEERTSYITVVLEDLHHPQNSSAVLRTCDCFGVQNVHVIENRNEFMLHKDIVLGSAQWLTIHKYNNGDNNTANALNQLKKEGYRIVATSPHFKDTYISDFQIEKGKSAFVFGTEKSGVSETVKSMADEFVKIPMYGFTESFNISVSAAMVLQTVTGQLRQSPLRYQLLDEEKVDLMIRWLRNTIKKVDLLEKKFLEIRQ